jgi:hypothetical protein
MSALPDSHRPFVAGRASAVRASCARGDGCARSCRRRVSGRCRADSSPGSFRVDRDSGRRRDLRRRAARGARVVSGRDALGYGRRRSRDASRLGRKFGELRHRTHNARRTERRGREGNCAAHVQRRGAVRDHSLCTGPRRNRDRRRNRAGFDSARHSRSFGLTTGTCRRARNMYDCGEDDPVRLHATASTRPRTDPTRRHDHASSIGAVVGQRRHRDLPVVAAHANGEVNVRRHGPRHLEESSRAARAGAPALRLPIPSRRIAHDRTPERRARHGESATSRDAAPARSRDALPFGR